VLTLVGAACGDDDDTGPSAGGEGGTSDVKVGMVYDITGKGDGSFNDSAYAGLTKAEKDLGVKIKDIEPSSAGTARQENLDLLASQGYNLIFGIGYLFGDPMGIVAPQYPDATFGIIDSGPPDGSTNVTGLVFAANEGSFLVGAAAGLKTKSGKIGFVGGQPGSLIGSFEAGFTAGVKQVNPSATVDVQYISDDPNVAFTDQGRARELAQGMIDRGDDIIFHAAGTAGGGMFEAVKAANDAGKAVWAIGVDSDQASPDIKSVSDEVKPFILTSMLKRLDTAVFDTIKAYQDGTLEPGLVTYDLKSDGVGYSTTGGHIDDIKDKLDDLKQQIIDGKITVPTEP
jgi:basic membrane protein A